MVIMTCVLLFPYIHFGSLRKLRFSSICFIFFAIYLYKATHGCKCMTYFPTLFARENPCMKQALLEAGANVDIKSGRRYHLMDEAVLTGDQAIVRQVGLTTQVIGKKK